MAAQGGDMNARRELLTRARELAPVLRGRSRTAEDTRETSGQTISDLIAKGLPRVCQPARFGGF